MEQQDFLFLLSTRLDNDTLRTLSHTPLWHTIVRFTKIPHFWYLRTEHLAGTELDQQAYTDWKSAYYLLSGALTSNHPFSNEVLANPIIVKILLDKGLDPSANGNLAIRSASRRGYTETIRLLLGDARVSTALTDCLRLAVREGKIEVVRLLLEDGRADPTAGDNEPIRWAASSGRQDIVQLLLADGRATL